MYRSLPLARATLAVVAILTLSAVTTAITHADGPLDGLEQLQGTEFGDMSSIVSLTPVVIPTPRVAVAPPPASAVEAPAAHIKPPDVAAPEGVAAARPSPSDTTVRLPATGSGARPPQPLHAAPWTLAAATMLALAGAASVLASRRTTHSRTNA